MKKIFMLKDYIAYAFRVTPFYTSLYLLLQSIILLMPMTQIIIVSNFINNVQDEIYNKTFGTKTLYYILLLIFSFILSYLLKLLSKEIIIKLSQKANYDFELSIVNKCSKLSYATIESSINNDLIERVLQRCDNAITQGLNSIMVFLVIFIRLMSVVIVLIRSSLWVSLIVFVLLCIMSFIAYHSGEREYASYKIATKHYRRARSYYAMINSREYADERRLFSYGEYINNMWEEEFDSGRKISLGVTFINFIRIKGLSIIMAILTFGIGAVMLIPLNFGKLTTGLYISIVAEVTNMVHNMSWALSDILQELILMKNYIHDYYDFLELPEWNNMRKNQNIKIKAEDNLRVDIIEFKNVSFKYPNTDKWVIHNLNLRLERGKTYAFVGENGAGKSTIIKLLLGIYKEYEGEIFINDIELRKTTSDDWYRFFSVVYQDFVRYQISVLDNVLIGKMETIEKRNKDKLDEIICQVGLNQIINSLPNGLDTELGQLEEEGHDLSGGEWQKLAIARALYGNHPIHILDEPTSSLDPIMEKKIYDCFYNISSGDIKIMISHRLGGIKNADEIIVLSNGRIFEKGNHQELLDKNDIYAKMYQNQWRWYNE